MKWTPDDITILSPSSYITNRHNELIQRRQLIDSIIEKAELSKTVNDNLSVNDESLLKNGVPMKLELHREGVKIIETPTTTVQNELSNTIISFTNGTDEEKVHRAILLIQSHERARTGRVIAIRGKKKKFIIITNDY